ncbi:MAG: carbohydrate ABC transporter permease [Acetanaerobacterium sp.]
MEMETPVRVNHKPGTQRTAFIKQTIVFVLLAAWAIIQLFPLVWLLLFSLKDNVEIFGGNILGLPHVWKFENYATVFTSGNVGFYFLNSVFVTVITIVISSILIATTSYAIARMRWKFSRLTLGLFLLGMMIPIHAALLPLFIILKNLHLLNTYLALIIPYTAFALPMGIFILTGFMSSIPRELEEAACIDGCSIYQIFFRIILPLIKPGLATIAIFTYLSTWNEMMFAITFINNESMKTLTVGIMSLAGQFATEWGPIGAGLMIATVPTLLIYALLGEQVQKSLVVGAVKG